MTDRTLEIYQAVKDGRSFSEIGRWYGISRQRAAEIYQMAEFDIERRRDDSLLTLIDQITDDRRMISQIMNTLHFYNIYSADDLVDLSDFRIRTMRKFGTESERIVRQMRELARGGKY